MKESEKISNKFDLMHLNTPKFARTTIQWDTKLLTPITRNRVLRKLHDPNIHIGHGDAGKMYYALANKFDLPELEITPHLRRDGSYSSTWVSFKGAPSYIREMVEQHYLLERAQCRLEGERHWGSETLHERATGTNFHKSHDFTDLQTAMSKFLESDEPKRRVRSALQFMEDGGILTFTYNPTDR